MKITIYDFSKKPKEVEITKEVASAVLLKISGDQCLFVKYKDGEEEWFDSCEGHRLVDFFDDVSFVELKDVQELDKRIVSEYELMLDREIVNLIQQESK